MTSAIRSLLVLLIVAGAWIALVPATEPPPPRTTGHVLILDNERTLEGNIERHGDQYCIRRAIGETWLPGGQVLCLCEDLDEAFRYLRARANLRDGDERLRLARWCLRHNLRGQALEEAKVAVELRPAHAESKRLLASLERSTAAAMTSTPRPAENPEASPSAVPVVDCNPEAIGIFTTKVQPILMNTCASCHASGKGGNFKLTRPSEEGVASRRALQFNLAAVLAQLHPDQPVSSPFLLKAVTVHGDAELPPIKNRQTAAYRILDDWVRLAVHHPVRETSSTTGTIDDSRPVFSSVPSRPEPAPTAPPKKVEPPAKPVAAAPSTAEVPEATPPAKPSAPPAPEPQPTPPAAADPFDPSIFNRQMHPDR